MDIKNQIIEQFKIVNTLLSSYVFLHDDIFKKQANLSSLFSKTDFESLYERTIVLNSVFINKYNDMIAFEKKLSSLRAAEAYQPYLKELRIFFEKLLIAVETLLKRQQLLNAKSKGERISYKEYREVEKRYKKVIKQYVQNGEKINVLYNTLACE